MFYRKTVLLLFLSSCFCAQSAMMPVDDARLKGEFKFLADSNYSLKGLKEFKNDLDKHQDYIKHLIDIVGIGAWLSRLQDNGFGFAFDENHTPIYITTIFLGPESSVALIPAGDVNKQDLIALKKTSTSMVIPDDNPRVISRYLKLSKFLVDGKNVEFKNEAEALFNNDSDLLVKRLVGALLHIFFSQELSEKLDEISEIEKMQLESDTPYWHEPYKLLANMHDHCLKNKVAEVFMDRYFRMLLQQGQLMLKRIFANDTGVSIYKQYEILNEILSRKMGVPFKYIDHKPEEIFDIDILVDHKIVFEEIQLTPEQVKLLPSKKVERGKIEALAEEIEAIGRKKKVPKKKEDTVQVMPKKGAKKELVPAKPVPAKPVPAKPVPAKPVPAKPVPAKPVPQKEVKEERALENAASFLEGWEVKGRKYKSARHAKRVFERQDQTRDQELGFNQIYHDYPLEFDGLLEHTGVQKTRPSSTRPGQNDTQYMLGGMIRYPDGTVETVVYSITKGSDGLIYHRGVERMNANDFIIQYSKQNAWVTDFPAWSEGGVDHYAAFAHDRNDRRLFERHEDSYCIYMKNRENNVEYIIYKRDTPASS